jgi:hypothetical protein
MVDPYLRALVLGGSVVAICRKKAAWTVVDVQDTTAHRCSVYVNVER